MSASASLPEATDGEAQDMTPVLVNGSPKLPRLPMPSAMDHESFDITLHRKDTEGFGFVILTSKSKPPYGGMALGQVKISAFRVSKPHDSVQWEVLGLPKLVVISSIQLRLKDLEVVELSQRL